ncbi:L-aspartate oxidase [Arenimonas sp.]|uniref:L-aspartate oxidase n=1 Tax=Arenimonas sp. TaxID=1872635 RepID=UPI0035AFFC2A
MVVGAGIAGLCVALAAAPRPVLLVSRSRGPAGTASAMAQGGIAAAVGEGDEPVFHAADTLVAGACHNHVGAVLDLALAAPDAIDWLLSLGVPFDRDDEGHLSLGREGGHDRARIVHAGGDGTGRELMQVLVAAVESAAHVQWLSGRALQGIGLCAGGRVAGVRISDEAGRSDVISTPDLVMATGGIGALFDTTTNPEGADGAGLALALAAGADGRDLEFIQWHPTAFALPSGRHLPLVTEALRGAGATLVGDDGAALMPGTHPLADLAPRDVVARRIWRHRRAGGRTWLDARRLDDAAWRQFPGVLATCAAAGIDPRQQPIPVTPAVHFHMGGIAVDDAGASTLPGLHAVGEVACSGVHGANRLASNSLLEGVVCGNALGARLRGGSDAGARVRRWVDAGPPAPAAARETLSALLTDALGPLRSGAALSAGIDAIRADAALAGSWQGRLALRLLAPALARACSLGAHFRVDSGAAGNIRHGIETAAYGEIA